MQHLTPRILRMKLNGFLFLTFMMGFILNSNAQTTSKKPLSTNDFAKWKVMNNPIVSGDGKYVSYEMNPQKGDGVLVIKPVESTSMISIC